MMGWIIFWAILLFFAILLSLSVVFRVEYGETLTVSVGMGGFHRTVFPVSEKEEDAAKKDGRTVKKDVRKESKSVSPKKRKSAQKGDIKETVFLAMDIVKSVLPPVKNLFRRVRVTSLSIEVAVGGEDAADTAVAYGKISALVYGGLAALRNLMRVKVKRVEINCNFLQTHTAQKVFFKVKIRVLFLILAGIGMVWRLVVNTFRRTKQNAANRQKYPHKGPAKRSPKGRTAAGEKRRM